jgi:hypothetical protein
VDDPLQGLRTFKIVAKTATGATFKVAIEYSLRYLDLWTAEKTVSLKALGMVKDEALSYLRTERNRLLGLSHAAHPPWRSLARRVTPASQATSRML